MELRQLRYAVAVAAHRHFTRAAASVPVAQPALSHQVRLLEQELGIELFERSRSGVRPTEAGEIFLMRARRALAEVHHCAAAGETRGTENESDLPVAFTCNTE